MHGKAVLLHVKPDVGAVNPYAVIPPGWAHKLRHLSAL
jgi:hypothetical protein